MPYGISNSQSDCSGWATVKKNSDGSFETVACHDSKQAAIDQMVAVSISEKIEPIGDVSRRSRDDEVVVVDLDETMVTKSRYPIRDVVDAVNRLAHRVFIVTGREEAQREQTLDDLEFAGIGYDALFMMPDVDDDIAAYKRATIEKLMSEHKIVAFVDDNDANRAAVESLGVYVMTPDEFVDAAIESGLFDGEEPVEIREVSRVAPGFMAASARRGLRLHEEGLSGDGLMPATVADARRMANREPLSERKWRRIPGWIARHMMDLDAVDGDEITPGLVAMLLWGGGSSKESARRAQAYAERIVERLEGETREQPRKPNGQWGSTGGVGATGDDDEPSGGGADDDDDYYALDEDEQGLDTISDEKADAIAQSLERKSDDFAKGGGQLDSVDDHDAGQVAVDSANETMNAMMKQPLLTTEQTQVTKGTQMTTSALSYAGEETHAVLLVKDKQGRTAGAMALDVMPKDAKGNDVDVGGYLNLEYVGSLGTVDGTGSALAREAISMAASQGAGLALVPLDSKAVSYWKTLGFVQPQGHRNGDMFLSAASARKIADRLGD